MLRREWHCRLVLGVVVEEHVCCVHYQPGSGKHLDWWTYPKLLVVGLDYIDSHGEYWWFTYYVSHGHGKQLELCAVLGLGLTWWCVFTVKLTYCGPRLSKLAKNISPGLSCRCQQLAARGTKERARLGWPFFCREKNLENYHVSWRKDSFKRKKTP